MWLWVAGLVVIILLLVGVMFFVAVRKMARDVEASQWQWK